MKLKSSLESTLIVVPCYKSITDLVSLCNSIVAVSEEININQADLLFVDDSPSCGGHSRALEICIQRLQRAGIKCRLHKNMENIGFVKSANIGLSTASRESKHCLLLNTDTEIYPSSLTELLSILDYDEMIGFVSPRSNNATICSLPSRGPFPLDIPDTIPASTGQSIHSAVKHYLPPFSYVPTVVGFCLLIRKNIYADFGGLDEIYGHGYEEENDLIMRANRFGYRAVIANYSYVSHNGTSSFSSEQRIRLQSRNSVIRSKRYPEYQIALDKYWRSHSFLYDRLVTTWGYRKLNQPQLITIAIDLTWINGDQHGTYKLCERLIPAFERIVSSGKHANVKLIAIASIENHHRVSALLGSSTSFSIELLSSNAGYDWLIEPRQHFNLADVNDISSRALNIAYFWLDTIADDCLYLSTESFSLCNWFASQFSSCILFNSEFSKKQFCLRYPPRPNVDLCAVGHSLDYDDYKLGSSVCPSSFSVQRVGVVGNKFKHKALLRTLALLSAKFSHVKFLALTAILPPTLENIPNILVYHPGLSDQDYSDALSSCDIIVFPSFYEGFGFTVPEALSLGKILLCRNSSLNRSLYASWNGPGSCLFYDDQSHLVSMLSELISSQPSSISTIQCKRPQVPPVSWDGIAEIIIERLLERVQPDFKAINDRIRISSILTLVSPDDSQSIADSILNDET